tara:strand:+ start:28 stop:351 length:324 start_codon:yes stop_codon:yes gene_type:complete
MTIRYKNVKAIVTGTTTAQSILTPANATTAVIKSIIACEQSGNADTITLTITAGSDVFSLFKVKAVSANTSIELLTAPLVLAESEILKAAATTANRLHVVVSFMEIS